MEEDAELLRSSCDTCHRQITHRKSTDNWPEDGGPKHVLSLRLMYTDIRQ